MQIRARWHAVGILLVALAAPRVAHAAGGRTDTLRRAVANVLLGPLDVALSPVVTAQACDLLRAHDTTVRAVTAGADAAVPVPTAKRVETDAESLCGLTSAVGRLRHARSLPRKCLCE